MPLTQQPFAHSPELDRLGHDLFTNISDPERAGSAALGVGLALAGLKSGGLMRWLLCLAGGALASRAITGHCPLYQQLKVSTRHEP